VSYWETAKSVMRGKNISYWSSKNKKSRQEEKKIIQEQLKRLLDLLASQGHTDYFFKGTHQKRRIK